MHWWEACRFWNPIVWLAMLATIVVGHRKQWLTRQEFVVSLGLLLIPYFTKGFEYGMISHARFAMIVFPAYIVLAKAPKWILIVWLTISVCAMGLFAHEFFMLRNGCY